MRRRCVVRLATTLLPATLLGGALFVSAPAHAGQAQQQQAQAQPQAAAPKQAPPTQIPAMPQPAPEDDPSRPVVYKKHTVINFGADLLDGDLHSPDWQFVEAEKRRGKTPLIQVRKDFRPELLRSLQSR